MATFSRQTFLRGAASAFATSGVFRVSAAHQVVQPYSVGGYVNYLEANTAAARYFGANLSRLTFVRQKYDPKKYCPNRVMFSGLDF